MNFFDKRRHLLDTALSMNRRGLNQGTSGNISTRAGKGFLITPSALPYDECRVGDVVWTGLDGTIQGQRKPSTEWRLHLNIYLNYPEAGAVLHAHSPWCTTLACLDRGIPAFHYMIALAGGDSIRCAPYAIFGSRELSDFVVEALRDRTACLLAHHGMVCFAENLKAVLALAVEVENLARVYVQCLRIAEPKLLSADEMGRVIDQFAEYRKAL